MKFESLMQVPQLQFRWFWLLQKPSGSHEEAHAWESDVLGWHVQPSGPP